MAKTEKIKVNTLWPHGEENLFGFTRNDWDDFVEYILTGRSGGDQIVCFRGSDDLVGREVEVLITEVTALTLFGELAEDSGGETVAAAGRTQGERTPR